MWKKKPDYVEDVDVSKLQLYVDSHHRVILVALILVHCACPIHLIHNGPPKGVMVRDRSRQPANNTNKQVKEV